MINTPVLCFHNISDRFEWGVNSYPVKSFERLIKRLLEEGYRFTLPDQVSEVQRPVILTFDDGYASVYSNALPLLSALKIPFIVFPVLEFLGKNNLWDSGALGRYTRHLSEEELKKCLEKGGKIGIHGLRHRAFSLMSEAEKSVELKRCYKIIRGKFSEEATCFAPPFGERVDGSSYFEKISHSFILDNQLWNGENRMVSRFTIYRYETPDLALKKIQGNKILRGLSKTIHLGAKATIFSQKIQKG